jgi:hypothetical protein
MALRFGLLDAVPVGEKNQEPLEPADHALGRSKGGFGTKLHILCDAEGHPLHFELSAGNVHDSKMFNCVLDGADDALYVEGGEAIPWPLALAGDKGYRANYIDQGLLELGITPVIPSKSNENRDSRAVDFDKTGAFADRGLCRACAHAPGLAASCEVMRGIVRRRVAFVGFSICLGFT